MLRVGLILAWLVTAFGAGLSPVTPAQAQTATQAYAQQKYNEYLQAHETAWRLGAQGSPLYQQYLEYERNAWNAYTQAQAAASQEAYQIAQHVAQVNAAISAWAAFIQSLYNYRDPNAYNNDPNYRARFDAWVQGQANYGNAYIAQLQAYRAQFSAAPNPPPPPSCDPNYCAPGGGPVAISSGAFR